MNTSVNYPSYLMAEFAFAAGAAATAIAAAGGFSHCLAPVAPPPPRYDIQLQVWARPLANGDAAALMFNRSPRPVLASLTWAMLGWPDDREARARDLWQHADVGQFAGGLTVQVAPHDVVALRLTPTTTSRAADGDDA